MADCKDRKKRLLDALIWDKIEKSAEEELVNLDAEMTSASLMDHFFDDLAEGCEFNFKSASKKFDADVNKFKPYIDKLGDYKFLLMNYAREEYQTMKESLFVILDSLRDSQRVIESTQSYFGRNAVKSMVKKIDNPAWKFQLKYSTKLTKRCANDIPQLSKFNGNLDDNALIVSEQMNLIKESFAQNAHQDYAKWDCAAMYPAPVRADLDVPNWIGGITNVAKNAFSIYN